MRSIFFAIFMLMGTLFTLNTKPVNAQVPQDEEYNYKVLGANIAPFMIKVDDSIVTNSTIQSFEKVMFVIFNPSCDHCVDFTKDLVKHADKFSNTAIVYISAPGMEEYLADFKATTGLDKLNSNNIFVGCDKSPMGMSPSGLTDFLDKIYEFKLPQINIYNQERTMEFRTLGDSDAKKVLQHVANK